jgi:O-antigen ligase
VRQEGGDVISGAIPTAAGPPARRGGWATPVIAAVASVTAGLALGLALYRFPLPLALAVAAGAGAVGVLALAVVRYHAAVALGVLLLGVVLIEPAPSDGVFLVVIAVAVATGRFSLHDVPAPVLGLLAAFAALNLTSAVQVADPERAAVFFGVTLYLTVLALWLPGYLTSTGRARVLVRAYLAAAVTSAALGVLALLTPLPGAELLAEGGRARALFQDPNVFGPFLVPAALILVDEILQPRLLSARLPVKAPMLGVLVLGVLFSYSRGAWLNLIVALLVMGVAMSLRRGGARRAAAFLALSVAVAAIAAAVVTTTGSADFLAERARSQSYDTERFSAQRAALRPAERYPFGAGPGQFESVAGISAHSTYARALGEQGFPGLLVVLALLALTLSFAVGNAVRGRSTHGIGSAALLAAWCGLLANSAFVDTLHWRHLWLVAALIWTGAMLRRGAQPSGGTGVARRGVHAGSE